MLNKPEIFTVARLNQEARQLLEAGLGTVWIEAELSNLSMPSSGHWYFSLKDAQAQVRCAMFRAANSHLDFKPKEGDKLLVRGKVSLYEPRGDYQLIVDRMDYAGSGALRLAFEKLKAKLAAEGLFDSEHKKPIPPLAAHLGVITSSTGAAIHDILKVLKSRFPALPVIIYPSLVQGDSAAESLAAAITLANQRKECDVLILARGGGSLEDLWCFNEEVLARAIFASKLPIVTGIGHEVDTTIADLVADHRAATPSAAAEFISPDQSEYLDYFRQLQKQFIFKIQTRLRYWAQHLHHLTKRLQDPKRKLEQQAQTLDYLQQNLIKAMQQKIKTAKQNLLGLVRALDAYNPLATLGRGYSITEKSGTIIRQANELKTGDRIETRLAEGNIISVVEVIK